MKLHQSIALLLEAGVTEILVLGPHKALSHIVQRHLDAHPTVRVHSTSSVPELRTVVRQLS
jgi:acyl transferase domain-containing protein